MLFDLSDAEVAQLQSIRDQLGPHITLRDTLAACIRSAAAAAPELAASRRRERERREGQH